MRKVEVRCDACGALLATDDGEKSVQEGSVVTMHFYVTYKDFGRTIGGEMRSLYSCPHFKCIRVVAEKTHERLQADVQEMMSKMFDGEEKKP